MCRVGGAGYCNMLKYNCNVVLRAEGGSVRRMMMAHLDKMCTLRHQLVAALVNHGVYTKL